MEGALAISVAEALDGTLKAENSEVEKLDAAVIAHAADYGGTASTGGYRSGTGISAEKGLIRTFGAGSRGIGSG